MSDIKAEPLALLDLVTTLAEIEKRWFYSANTVREWILDGKIRARQSGRVWLIEVPSLLAFLAWRIRETSRP